MTAKERTISLFQRASKLQVGLNSRQFLLLQWPQKGMYDCSQTVQWGHITEACITQPFVVCQQIYFAQQFIVECWQFGCKSPFCTRFVCLFAGRLVPTSTRSAKRSSSGLFHKTHKPQHQNTDEQSVFGRAEQKKVSMHIHQIAGFVLSQALALAKNNTDTFLSVFSLTA